MAEWSLVSDGAPTLGALVKEMAALRKERADGAAPEGSLEEEAQNIATTDSTKECTGSSSSGKTTESCMKKAFATLIVLVSMSTMSPLDRSMANEPSPNPKVTYLVLYSPGPTWVAGKGVSEQPLKEHGKYMLDLYRRGKMKFAGPFTDDTGGAAVIEAADQAEAEAILSKDPGVTSGVMKYMLRPWDLKSWHKYTAKK